MDAPSRWKELSKRTRNTVFGITLVLVTILYAWSDSWGSSSGADLEQRQPAATTTTRAPLRWLDHYDYDLKRQVDRFGQSCSELQEAFDWIDSARDGLRRRYGSNGYQILEYLDDKMRGRGCYG